MPTTPPTQPLTVWVASDGRTSNEGQALGLAESIARERPAEIAVKRIAWKGRIGRLPWWLNPLPRRALVDPGQIAPPWPDLWISAGRAALPIAMRLRKWSRGRSFVAHVQDPRMPTRLFDLVIPPRHDRLQGENVFPITGAPHRITPQRLKAERARFAALLDPLPRPRVAVLIGGKSKAFDLSPERAAAMAHEIERPVAEAGGSVMVTFSRRTPEPARAILAARLKHMPGVVWDGEGDNPYFAFLASADYVLATEDSTNMATEAASTGAPLFILKMDGQSLKFGLLHEDLETLGISRPFGGAFHSWTYEPLRETERAAAEILRRLDARAP